MKLFLRSVSTLKKYDKIRKNIDGINFKFYEEIRQYNRPTGNINIEEGIIYVEMLHPKGCTFDIQATRFNVLPCGIKEKIFKIDLKGIN